MARPGSRALKDAMEYMIKIETDELKLMKRNSIAKVKKYTWDIVARMTLEKISEKLK